MLKKYVEKIKSIYNSGDAREESFYGAVETLLSDFADSINKKKIHITTLPKKTEAGNPDFRIWDGKVHIVGYIEAKKLDENLDRIEGTEQLKRYLSTFSNLILTNYSEFRLYRNGQLIDKVEIFRPYIIKDLKRKPPLENEKEFKALLEKFFSFSTPKVSTAKTLAMELAKKTRFLRDNIIKQLLFEKEDNNIKGFYQAFEKYLIAGLTKEGFADLYSQTLTYGLFAARTRAEGEFTRKNAYEYIPHTIGILREVFKFISLDEIPQELEWIIDDIVEILSVSNVKKILSDFYNKGKGKDPIIHFYETFLAEYDPKMREKRGVYYTPEPVVHFIVKSVHNILKENFNKPDGLANKNVTVLDPAAGTMTFIAEAVKIATEEYVSKYGEGGKSKFLKENILKNFYAFELLMAPYAIGHLKMSFLFEELGYKLNNEDRVKLYLTNTLDMKEHEAYDMPGIGKPLSIEAKEANKIKKDNPILVIIGNPPYSGHSSNKGEWIVNLLKNGYKKPDNSIDDGYYKVNGNGLNERNPKWLQDDYVKFIRFGQWKIDQNGEGVLGFITNHGYLDNPTFRGMRQSLMKTFDEIYFLDLHGNSLKKEKCPDGSKDENVFDIKQGVAIALFIKNRNNPKQSIQKSDLYGLRENKYEILSKKDKNQIKWKKLKPKSELYLFDYRDEKLLDEYSKFYKITEIFPVNSVGIVTARDNFTIKCSEKEVWNTINNFIKLDNEIARKAYNLGKDVRDWKVSLAKEDLMHSGPKKENIIPILYRPFDKKFTYYTGKSRGFHCMPRVEVMKHMIEENLGLLLSRQMDKSGIEPIFITEELVDAHAITSATSITYLFPLFLYPDKDKKDLFSNHSDKKKQNINEKIYKELNNKYDKKLYPEQILAYIYGVLYSNEYREKYKEFLKSDFPRIPFVDKYSKFKEIAQIGQDLIDLHLMKSKKLDKPISKFDGKGNCKVEKIKYDSEQKRIYINLNQYFNNVTQKMFEYQIGGYQVLAKWLKDRKSKTLSSDEIQHYCRVATVIRETINIVSKK